MPGREVPSESRTDPFFLKGGGAGCLLVHGFTASPHDMRGLARHLHARGHTASAVRLAGHGSTPEDLEPCRWHDWYESTLQGLERLRGHAQQVVAVGQSMGALLALKLAAENPSAIQAVALLSPALRLTNPWLERLAPLLPLIAPFVGYHHKGESDIADEQERRDSPSYRRVPLRAVHQFLLLQRHVHGLLGRVRQPTLVIHSRQDHACPLENVELVERSVDGHRRSVILDDSYHVISVDVERDRVATEVAAFVDSIVSSSDAGTSTERESFRPAEASTAAR